MSGLFLLGDWRIPPIPPDPPLFRPERLDRPLRTLARALRKQSVAADDLPLIASEPFAEALRVDAATARACHRANSLVEIGKTEAALAASAPHVVRVR